MSIIFLWTRKRIKCTSRIINTAFIFVSIILAVCILNFFTGLIQVYFLIHTPTWVTMLVIMVLCALIAGSGIEVMGRLFTILIILGILIYFPGQSMGIGQYNMENVLPILFTSPFRIVAGTYENAGQISDALLFVMVMTSALPSPAKYYKVVSAGFIASGFLFGLAGITVIALLGIEIVSSTPLASLTIVQSIQVGGFLGRSRREICEVFYQKRHGRAGKTRPNGFGSRTDPDIFRIGFFRRS